MSETKFRKINNLLGWLVFSIALITYGLTVEPTASYWDAGEYIATSAKLQVGHPPGAPLYQMLGAVFSLFATDTEKIALAVNYLSVVSSAFVILFLFWSITLLLRKIYDINDQINSRNIFLSALIITLLLTSNSILEISESNSSRLLIISLPYAKLNALNNSLW